MIGGFQLTILYLLEMRYTLREDRYDSLKLVIRLFYLFFILLFGFILVLQFELIKELPDLLTGKKANNPHDSWA